MRLCWDRWRRCSLISAGPVAQLMPMMSTFSGSMAASAAPISVPGSMRPVSSMVTWAWIGHLAAGLGHGPAGADDGGLEAEQVELGLDDEQVDAALEQARGLRPRRRRAARRSGSGRATANFVPGPIEPATKRLRSGVEKSSATSRAMRALARAISWDRSAMSYSPSGTANAPKVLVSTTSAPDLEVGACGGPSTTSGRVMPRMSVQPSRSGPPKSSAVRSWVCSHVPVAPS